jgi:hypothetical protein
MSELRDALVAAQVDLQNPPKTSTARVPTKSGGSYTYTYAPLPEILDAVRPILHKHGLAISQDVVGEAGYVGVVTRLIHESGEDLISGPVMLPATDPQQAGAVITYLRRYSLCAVLGIAADEDDDATKASPVAGGRPTASALDPGDSSAIPGEVMADTGPGEARPKPSPGSTKYPLANDPAKCSHKFPSGRWLTWDADERCPTCGTARLVAMEGTTADLGPA